MCDYAQRTQENRRRQKKGNDLAGFHTCKVGTCLADGGYGHSPRGRNMHGCAGYSISSKGAERKKRSNEQLSKQVGIRNIKAAVTNSSSVVFHSHRGQSQESA